MQNSMPVEQWMVDSNLKMRARIVVQKLVKAADDGLPPTYMLNLLEKLPTELDKLLQNIFQSIDSAFRSDTLRLVQWTLFATRPLYLAELDLAFQFSTADSVPASLEDFSLPLDGREQICIFSAKANPKHSNYVWHEFERF